MKNYIRPSTPLILLIISVIFTLPFLINWSWIGVGDWELFATMAAVPHKTVVHFGQFPFWNPYLGGGNILFHHPEVGILSPFFILILIFGPVAGIKLQMLICYFLGFYGTYLLARILALDKPLAFLVSFVYFGSSYFALHYAIGHVPFTHFCFLPWFIFFILRSEDNWKCIFGAAVAIALIVIGNGAAVPFLYTCFFSGLFLLLYAIEQRKYRLIRKYIVAVLFGLLLAAVKFIPMYHYLSQVQWAGMATDVTPAGFLLKAFFSFDQLQFGFAKTAEHWGWHEYAAYISPLALITAVVAVIYSFKKSRIWIILAAFFFIFGLGHFGNWSLWSIFTSLPGFESIRSPGRAFQFVILPAAFLSGMGWQIITAKWRASEKVKRSGTIILLVIIIGGNFLINLPAFNSITYKKPIRQSFSDDFRHIIGSKYEIYDNFQKNRGSLAAPWLSAYRESRGIVTPDNQVLMEYIMERQGEVVTRRYTPNKVVYDLRSASAGVIVFGIGYDEGWHAEDGRDLFDRQGLVSTNFRAGRDHIVLKYRPPYFYLGLIISLISIVVGLLTFFETKPGRWLKPIFD